MPIEPSAHKAVSSTGTQVEWSEQPADMSADDPNYECGEAYNHDAHMIHGEVTEWVCRRCGAEGWAKGPAQHSWVRKYGYRLENDTIICADCGAERE